MSLITRCPACQTLFKVVPDQLRISGGWVRCGMCDEIFDAASHAQQESSPPVPLASQAAGMATIAPESVPDVHVASGADDTTALVASTGVDVEMEIEATASASITDADADADAELPAANDVSEPNADHEIQAVTGAVESPVEHLVEDNAEAGEPVQEPDPVVSFMKGAKGQSAWHRSWVRATLAVACTGLLLGLGLQVVLHERNWLAASMPQVRPALVAVCASLDCTISPLQQIESIVIESSAFARVRGEVYRLNFAVKNTSGIELATPALELTLTDAQDQGVMRRVFTPVDLAAPSNVLAPESDWTGAVSVAVLPVVGSVAERIAGYRLLVFYP